MRKGLLVLSIVFVLCMSVASAYIGYNRGYGRQGTFGQPYAGSSYGTVDTWNTGLGYNRGYGRDGSFGKPFAGTARPVDTWNTGLGKNVGFGRDGYAGRYGTGYKNYYRPARYNTYAYTGTSVNAYSNKARFSTFGRHSFNPAPSRYRSYTRMYR